MDDFLNQLSENSLTQESLFGIGEQTESIPISLEGKAIDIDGDAVADGFGYDRDGDGCIDMIQYDFNHDGVVDAVGIDTTGDGIIDTIYYDFNHDGIADAKAFDSTGDGTIDTMTFAANGVSIYSDVGFTVSSAWDAGAIRMNSSYGLLSDQSKQLGLNDSEREWAQKAIDDEKMTPATAKSQISFGASTTCIGGQTGCTGCAGILIDKKIGCKTGACTGGTRIP